MSKKCRVREDLLPGELIVSARNLDMMWGKNLKLTEIRLYYVGSNVIRVDENNRELPPYYAKGVYGQALTVILINFDTFFDALKWATDIICKYSTARKERSPFIEKD